MSWILKRLDQGGGYVALPGSKRSYTVYRDKARRYDSREAAVQDACGNELPTEY